MKTKKIIFILFLSFFILQNLFATTNYVSKTGAHISPFSSWANAATNIKAAVDVASAGDIVLVNDGVYDTGETVTLGYYCLNRVVIIKNIIVKSQNGPKTTFILGKGPNGVNAVRGVYMSTGTLSGFTVSNGYTMTNRDWDYDMSGGGVNMKGGNGIITNCIISGNSALIAGGGTFYGTVNNCTISGNSVVNEGGGTFYGTVNNCTISGNSANHGGGTFYGTVNNCIISGNSANYGGGGTQEGSINNCTITGNSASDSGGGTYYSTVDNCIISGNFATNGGGTSYGTVNNCIITGNSADSGGGTYYSTVTNCTISGNSADSGGGASGGTLNNCIISGNSARNNGGGTDDATINNCTITGNSASGSGGGTYYGVIHNCIIWNNSATNNENFYGSIIKYSDSFPLPVGEGNISNNPQFVSVSNYHLEVTSPCIDAGTNSYAPMPYDLDGNPRIIDGTVDMGAYEFVPEPCYLLFMICQLLFINYWRRKR